MESAGSGFSGRGDRDEGIEELARRLTDRRLPLPQRFRVLFSLRNVKNSPVAQEALLKALNDPSALFRHEVAFCLGQMQGAEAVPALVAVLQDHTENSMVRHEAGEALGAIGTPQCIGPLKEGACDALAEVAETCQLALRRIQHARIEEGATASSTSTTQLSPYLSVDPAPAAAVALDASRYAAMFALRNRGGEDAASAIAAAFGCKSALLRHEVAYVLGQLQHPCVVPTLARVLSDQEEHPMVRHEAAEALGSIADASCIALLQQFQRDPEPIVSESCDVALDILQHEMSGGFEYADLGSASEAVAVC
eukprot:jgi/Chlat1/3026/Chrsp201S03278